MAPPLDAQSHKRQLEFYVFQPNILFLVSERKIGIFSKIKDGENYNHRNTLKYFEDYNLSLTQRLGKTTVFGQALVNRFLWLHTGVVA
jgi:hypothetical protein